MRSPSELRTALREWRARDPVDFRVAALLAGVALLLVVRLIVGDNPWEGGIAERLGEGKHLRPVDFARTYGWWSAALNLPLCLGLLATRRHWFTRSEPRESISLRPPDAMPRRLVVATLAAVVVLALLGLPRLGHSFWDDEEYSVRVAIDGAYFQGRDDQLDFDDVRWRDTLWHYHKPSNHVPQSILSRLALGVWRWAARPELHFASETVTRLPVFAAGLAALVAVAVLLWRLGHGVAGVFAAWLLALHPWHLRYATEARGYALLILLVPTTLLLLTRALHLGTWPRWLLYGGAQLLLIWSFPGALFMALVMNVATALWLWAQTRGTEEAWPQATRFGMANLSGFMIGLWLMLPNMAQLRVFMAREDLATLDVESYLPDFLSHLWLGTPWIIHFRPGHFVDAVDLAARWPAPFQAVLWATVLLAAAGALRLLLAGGPRAMIGLILLLPGPLSLGTAWLRGTFLNQWYLIFVLPAFAIWVGLGLEWPLRWKRLGGGVAAVAGGLYLVGYAWLTQVPRTDLRTIPLQPVRESVALTRQNPNPFAAENQDILTASFQTPPSYYDPLVQVITEPEELRTLLRRADAGGLALFVNIGRPGLAEKRHPELMATVEREDLFERVAELVGSSPRGVRRVYRYRNRAQDGSSDGTPPPVEP